MAGIVIEAVVNAARFKSGMDAIAASTKQSLGQISNSLSSKASEEVQFWEQQLIAARKYGAAAGDLVKIERNLATARAEAVLAQEADIAAKSADTAATSANTAAKIANAASQSKINTIFSQFIVIGKDLARGQTARAISAFLTLLQKLGISLIDTIPILAEIVILVAGVSQAFAGWAKGEASLLDGVRAATDALEAHAKAGRDAREEARRWADEMEKINKIGHDDSLTKSAEDRVAAMRKQFEMQQKIAKLNGQTPQESIEAQKEQAKHEAEEYQRSAEDAKQKAAKAKADADAVNARVSPQQQHVKEDLEKAQKRADEALEKLKTVSAAKAEGGAGSLVPTWLGGKGFHPLNLFPNIFRGKGNEDLISTKEGGMFQGEVTEAHALAEKQLAMAKSASDELEKQKKDALDAYRKAQEDADRLQEKAKATQEVEDAEDAVDDSVKSKNSSERRGSLTELQRIGGAIGASVSVIDVNRGIAKDVKRIASHLDRNQSPHSGSSNGHIGGF